MSDLVEVGQSEQHLELVIVLLHASVARLLEAELMLDHPKGMFHLGSQVSFCRLKQIFQSSLCRIGQGATLAWPHGYPELAVAVLEFFTLLNAEMA